MPAEGNTLTQVVGTTRAWKVTATSAGRPMTGVFTGADALSAVVWEGDSRAALFHPTVTWIDPAAGTIQLVITSAQLAAASVTRGLYRLEITVTPASDGQARSVCYRTLRFLPTAGSDAAVLAYASYEDLTTWSREVEKLANPNVDQAQFAEARGRARTVFNTRILNLYRPRPGGAKRYVSEDGTTTGPYLRYASSPDGSPPPTPAALAGWLTPTRLILNEDVIEANARLAASIIYGSTPGSNNAYQQMAAQERALAEEAACRAIIEIDTTTVPDGVADIRVGRDVTYLT